MIVSFRHRGLNALFERDDPSGIRPDLVDRVRARLSALENASAVEDLNMPGWRLHPLQGKPRRWAIAVNGPWRITFEWGQRGPERVDLEQYH
jgi:proteic killer suppression protein